jgi:hypothetical protein
MGAGKGLEVFRWVVVAVAVQVYPLERLAEENEALLANWCLATLLTPSYSSECAVHAFWPEGVTHLRLF